MNCRLQIGPPPTTSLASTNSLSQWSAGSAQGHWEQDPATLSHATGARRIDCEAQQRTDMPFIPAWQCAPSSRHPGAQPALLALGAFTRPEKPAHRPSFSGTGAGGRTWIADLGQDVQQVIVGQKVEAGEISPLHLQLPLQVGEDLLQLLNGTLEPLCDGSTTEGTAWSARGVGGGGGVAGKAKRMCG